jgi:DNA-binding winged helix-turn-helix (wHTH) protein
MPASVAIRVVEASDGLSPTVPFMVGDWLVEPGLCRVSRGDSSTHVRPQLMDLLVYLAQNAGRTVPQDDLHANIWPEQPFLTATALPRCITELRHALGDRAGASALILTVHKRGYRLIAPVTPAG